MELSGSPSWRFAESCHPPCPGTCPIGTCRSRRWVERNRRVELDAVRGTVKVLTVSGVWWTKAALGSVLCSIDTVESGLRGEQ